MRKAKEAFLKTPITYYGGKATMLRHILPKIPMTNVYNEPYCGGCAVLFALSPRPCEMINDINDRVINFYRIYQTKFDELYEEVKCALIARKLHIEAREIYQNPKTHSLVKQAWAFWILSNTAFNGDFYGNIKFSRNPERSYKWIRHAKENLKKCARRIETLQIDCRDAKDVIDAMDTENTFHYIDPPYMDADQGHYYGFTPDKWQAQLEQLPLIKGKFLLSCYWGPQIEESIAENKWNFEKIKKKSSASNMHGKRKDKVEVLVWNYQLSQGQLFK